MQRLPLLANSQGAFNKNKLVRYLCIS